MAPQMFASELDHENLNEPHAHSQDSISTSVPTVHTPNNVISSGTAFDLRSWIENRNLLEQSRGVEPKSLGLAWHDVAVLAAPETRAAFVHTLPIAILNTFGPDALRIASGAFHSVRRWVFPVPPEITQVQEDSMRKLIRGHTGVLKDGEMLLVLGRPGSGCSTFLKAISSSLPPNVTLHPASKISYGGLPPSEIMGELRGEVIYSSEEDIHIPGLSVADTLRFALRSKVPARDKRPAGESRQQFVERSVSLFLSLGVFFILTYSPSTLDVFLKMFRISHVRDTIVGDAYKRYIPSESVLMFEN
jgi:ATP-binding cassette, subfamily G (WHITE), member 2, PDR